MFEKVKVILRNGDEVGLADWQKMYGLVLYSNQIGRNFSLNEFRFKMDIEQYGELIVSELLMRVMDDYRDAINTPVTVNSFNRNDEKQKQLKSQGLRAATNSPHVVKLAADLDTPGIDDLRRTRPKASKDELWNLAVKINRDYVSVLREVAKRAKIAVRIGSEQYLKDGSTFIHLDVCPEYYGKGKPWCHFPHPAAWENAINW